MSGDPVLAEMEKEIDNMNLEQLLYVRIAPQNFINKKFQSKIDESKNLIKEIEIQQNYIKNNEAEVRRQNEVILKECDQLKREIELTKNRINGLLQQKRALSRQPTKEEFLTELDKAIKNNFKTPDNYFREFLSKKISESEFLENLKNLGTGKNYYYYKILSERIKEM